MNGCNFIKIRFQHRRFPVNIAKFLYKHLFSRTYLRTTVSALWKFGDLQFWRKNQISRSSRMEVFCRKGVLENSAKFIGKHLCWTPAKIFSYEFCEIFKKTFTYRTPQLAASQFTTTYYQNILPNYYKKNLCQGKF